jgi:hypothetical protein
MAAERAGTVSHAIHVANRQPRNGH